MKLTLSFDGFPSKEAFSASPRICITAASRLNSPPNETTRQKSCSAFLDTISTGSISTNWQEPIPLEQIKSLKFTAAFDNSGDNPANPDPKQTVTWGDQTWEEMAVVFAIVSRTKSQGRTGPP